MVVLVTNLRRGIYDVVWHHVYSYERRQKWIEIATLHLQLGTYFIKLYLQLMYSKLCTIFHSFGNAMKKHITLNILLSVVILLLTPYRISTS